MSPRQAKWRAGAWSTLLAAGALMACTPLLQHGVSCGHDLGFHLLNWLEVSSQWRAGIARPFWSPHAAYHAGEARFLFYPPLSWVLGAALSQVIAPVGLPAAYTAIVLFLCGATMYRLLLRLVPVGTAMFGAILYMVNPYMLFVAWQRTAYAELLAAAWTPLLLLAVLQRPLRPIRLSCAICLIWITNVPAAVLGSYCFLFCMVVRLWLDRYKSKSVLLRTAIRSTTGYLLGLSFASYYLLPAVVQRKSVQVGMLNVPGMRPQDSFIFHPIGEPFHDAVLLRASWIAVALLVPGIAAGVFLLLHKPTSLPGISRIGELDRELAIPVLLALSLAILFLLTPLADPLWRALPELSLVQFPWRFLVMQAACTLTLIVLVVPWRLPMPVVGAMMLLIPFAAGRAANARFRQACDADETVTAQAEDFKIGQGPEPLDEYTPVDADNDALKANLPPAWLQADAENSGRRPNFGSLPAQVHALPLKSPIDVAYSIDSQPRQQWLILRLRNFPGWHVTVDGVPDRDIPQRDDGLIAVPLTPGRAHEVAAQYVQTPDERIGAGVSLISITGAAAWSFRRRLLRARHT